MPHPQPQPQLAQLAIWTKKFAYPLFRLHTTNLQKITATDKGELILSVYKPQDDRSLVILSVKQGESGIVVTQNKPVTLKQPNSFVQIARKYLQNRKITAAYATLSPICVVIEFANPPSHFEEINDLLTGPNCLVLDLDAKPPRHILAKKTFGVPERYQIECKKNFSAEDAFFESWCEWSVENTKTKKRAAFLFPLISYCPLLKQEEKQLLVNTNLDINAKISSDNKLDIETKTEQGLTFNLNTALNYLPTHIRRSARTKLQFLERRLHRQKFDLPTEQQLARLKKQSENLKNVIYLWPPDSLTWYVPTQFIEEYSLNPIYSIKKGEKPSTILTHLFHEIEVLERRKYELGKRLLESESSLLNFQNLVLESAQALKAEAELYPDQEERKVLDFVLSRKEILPLHKLCKYLDIAVVESEQIKKIKREKEERLPYRSYMSSTGQFIRVARSASDSEIMLKKMPSHHYWLHVLTGEGSHVWLEKQKGEKKISPTAMKEAGILAIHHSKHSRAQNAEVQFATRADIEKKKNLPIGKVLVRRCETFIVRYDDDDLKRIIEGEK